MIEVCIGGWRVEAAMFKAGKSHTASTCCAGQWRQSIGIEWRSLFLGVRKQNGSHCERPASHPPTRRRRQTGGRRGPHRYNSQLLPAQGSFSYSIGESTTTNMTPPPLQHHLFVHEYQVSAPLGHRKRNNSFEFEFYKPTGVSIICIILFLRNTFTRAFKGRRTRLWRPLPLKPIDVLLFLRLLTYLMCKTLTIVRE